MDHMASSLRCLACQFTFKLSKSFWNVYCWQKLTKQFQQSSESSESSGSDESNVHRRVNRQRESCTRVKPRDDRRRHKLCGNILHGVYTLQPVVQPVGWTMQMNPAKRSSQDAHGVIRLTRSKAAVCTLDDAVLLIEWIFKKFRVAGCRSLF